MEGGSLWAPGPSDLDLGYRFPFWQSMSTQTSQCLLTSFPTMYATCISGQRSLGRKDQEYCHDIYSDWYTTLVSLLLAPQPPLWSMISGSENSFRSGKWTKNYAFHCVNCPESPEVFLSFIFFFFFDYRCSTAPLLIGLAARKEGGGSSCGNLLPCWEVASAASSRTASVLALNGARSGPPLHPQRVQVEL